MDIDFFVRFVKNTLKGNIHLNYERYYFVDFTFFSLKIL